MGTEDNVIRFVIGVFVSLGTRIFNKECVIHTCL